MEYNNCYRMRSNEELYHYGVKGQKWGVRRYQNKDGSLTPAGRKHQARQEYKAERNAAKAKYKNSMRDISGSDSDRNKRIAKRIAKRVAAAVVMTATVSAAAALYAKNPEAVNRVVSKVGKATVSGLKKGGSKAISAGKKYMKDALQGAKEGFQEGVKEAPKKAVKAVVTGAALMGAKRLLDASVGKEESARIFQANNNKKISSFWKVSGEDKEDDD